MKVLLWIVVVLVLIVAVLGIMAPKNYDVNRSIEINKPVEEVYPYLTSLKSQREWSPWEERDPHQKVEYTGTDGSVGFTAKWESDSADVGSGEQEITKLAPNESIEMRLTFLEPYESHSTGYINTEATSAGGTKVTWGFRGDNKFPMSIMMLFMDMDGMVGPDFEKGLSKLKGILEAQAAPVEDAPAEETSEAESTEEETV